MIREKRELAMAQKVLAGRKLLEFGCGDGRFLRLAKKRGWQGIGLESNRELADYCTKTFGLDVRVGDLGGLSEKEGPFDLVVCRYVLEHLRDPASVLDQIRSVCAPGALLIIKVPNLKGWQQRLFGERWFPYQIRDHTHFFDRAVLTRMVKDSGFEPVAIDSPISAVDFLDFAASLAPSWFPPRGPTFLPLAALSLLACIPAIFFSLLGAGGTLRLIAKKKKDV